MSGRRNLMYVYWGQISTFHLQKASQPAVFVICFLLPFSIVKTQIETCIFWLCIEIEWFLFFFILLGIRNNLRINEIRTGFHAQWICKVLTLPLSLSAPGEKLLKSELCYFYVYMCIFMHIYMFLSFAFCYPVEIWVPSTSMLSCSGFHQTAYRIAVAYS